MSIPAALESKHLYVQNKTEPQRSKKIHPCKQKEREAAGDGSGSDGTRPMGTCCPGEAMRRPSCASIQQPSPSNLTCQLASTASCTTVNGHGHSSCKKWEGGSCLCLPSPCQYTCTQMRVHFYYGPVLPWRNCNRR